MLGDPLIQLQPDTLRKLLKEEMSLGELMPGLTAKQQILHMALEAYAIHGNGDVWKVIETEFDSFFTLEDFLVSSIDGPDAGISGLSRALSAFENKRSQTWKFIITHFGKQLTLAHFLAAPNEGPHAGMSGFWQALKTIPSYVLPWNFITEQFSDQLRLEHFLTAPIDGPHAGISGLWLLLSQESYDLEYLSSSLWYRALLNQLKVQHIEQIAALDNQSKAYSVLHLLCRKSIPLTENLVRVLMNNADAVLKINSILSDPRIGFRVRSLVIMHKMIVILKADIATGVKEDLITSQIDDLVNYVSKLCNPEQSAGYFFLAQCLFTNNSQLKERLSCLSQIDEKSPFAQEAALEQANLLLITECDKDGNALPSDRKLRKHARKTALEAALKLVTSCPKAAHLKESYDLFKRGIVAKLLDDEIPFGDREAYRWAIEITDYAALLKRIPEEKIKRLKKTITKMNTQLDSVSSELKTIKDVLSTNGSSPLILMKEIADLRSAVGLEKTTDKLPKGQLKITDIFKPELKRQP